MNKILLHSESLESAKEIKEIYEKNMEIPIFHSFDERNIERLISRNLFSLMVMECQEFGINQYNLVKDLRDEGFFHPIMVVAADVPKGTATQSDLQLSSRIHFIPKPIVERTLIGVSKKLIHTKNIPQQRFPRFFTDQYALMESTKTGETIMSNMYNLSKGGAYFEYSHGEQDIPIGDILKVKVILTDVEQERIMKARVVWKTREGSYSGRSGLGTKFVGI